MVSSLADSVVACSDDVTLLVDEDTSDRTSCARCALRNELGHLDEVLITL